jgi:hypothetical protein
MTKLQKHNESQKVIMPSFETIMDDCVEHMREAVHPYLVPGRPEWDRAEAWLSEVAGHLIHRILSDKTFACGTTASHELIAQVASVTARLYCRAIIIVAEELGFTGDRVREMAHTHDLGDLA